MSETIFRKESLERVKSPENLEQYIHVANPSGWILIVCILCLLAGFTVWGLFGKIETTVSATVSVANGTAVCTLQDETQEEIAVGVTVRIGEEEGSISEVNGDGTYTVKISLADGDYEAVVVTEVIKPISLIFD